MPTGESSASQSRSAFVFDRAFFERIEKDPRATWWAIGIVALAGAGRGMTPGFEAGSVPLVTHGIAGLLIWLFCAGLVWNVAHRLFGYEEGLIELTRVLGFSAAPLIGLWLNSIEFFGESLAFTIGLHLLAFAGLVLATRGALSISLLRSLGICAVALSIAVLLLFVLGLFLVGSPASLEVAGMPVENVSDQLDFLPGEA